MINQDITDIVSVDKDFSDEFLEKNEIQRINRIKIPLSRYTYPSKVLEIIDRYIKFRSSDTFEEFVSKFFNYENLYKYLVWLNTELKKVKVENVIFYGKGNTRNIPYLVALYLDYLNGVSIKEYVKREESKVMGINKKGQLYFRFSTIYINTSKNFQHWEVDELIDFDNLKDSEVKEFENKYIIQLLHDINHFCGYSLKKIFMVTLGSAFDQLQKNDKDLNSYNEYWNMLEAGTLNKKAIKLLSKGIEDKYLQNRILANDETYFKIIQSKNVLETIIDIYGKNSIEYYVMIL